MLPNGGLFRLFGSAEDCCGLIARHRNRSEGMKTTKISLALLLASSLSLAAQQDSKPNPHEGVSHPPDDNQILVTTGDDAAKPAVKQSAPATPAVSQSSTQTVVPASDADIMSLPPAATVAKANSPTAPLQTRPAPVNPDGDIVQLPSLKPGELRAGTPIHVSLLTSLSTAGTVRGQKFASRVTSDVIEGGKVIIPSGAEIRGRVTEVNTGNHFGSRATIHLRPDEVVLPDGSRYQLHAQVIHTEGTDTKANDEGSITPKPHVKRDATEYAMAAGSGAIIGAKFGGPTGALVGTLVGAGLVTTHVLLHNPQAELPKDSEITFSLTEPMELTSIQN